jgi:hypothetical protein
MLSSGWFNGAWNLNANISEHPVCSIFIDEHVKQGVPKHWHLTLHYILYHIWYNTHISIYFLSEWFCLSPAGALAYPEGGFGGSNPPEIIPKFWQSRAEFPVPWKIDLKNLIRIRVSPICKLGGTLDYGVTAPPPPRSLVSLPSVLNWICWKFLGTPLCWGVTDMIHSNGRH